MSRLTIVLTGGGSGGHITPILAVAHELKQLHPGCHLIYIGQTGDKLADIPAADPSIDAVYTVWAGKLRRYHGEGWRQLLDIRSQALNIRDLFRVLRGTLQSYWLLHRLQPAAIFTRGGFVSVPVAFGGRLNHIPYLTHDSDSTPSLANRLIARGAAKHAVALPAELYPYPVTKTVMVGVPVSTDYQPVTASLQQQFLQELGLGGYTEMVFVTGGGNGARMLNQALVANATYLLTTFPDLVLVHVAGRALEAETNAAYDALELGTARSRIRVFGFMTDLHKYSGAADVIIARAGATNLAEFALQAKACIMVPPKQLAWAVRNSQVLADRGAVLELNEDQAEQPERLGRLTQQLLEDPAQRLQLGRTLATYARPQAAADTARLILSVAGGEPDAATKN